jgi:hypothetical protein
MGVPTSKVGYTLATTGRGDHEVHKGHVVALEKKILCSEQTTNIALHNINLLKPTGYFTYHQV